MSADEHAFDPPLPTPGAVRCANHVARGRERDGVISWYCRLCGKDLVMVTGKGLR